MKSPRILLAIVVFFGVYLNAAPTQGSENADEFAVASAKPNIILVFIDDMGWADFSCFGNKEAATPNIDALASKGIAFEQFYVNSPICSPSRTAISTGQYPQRWRIGSYLDNRKANAKRGVANWLDPKAPMLAKFLNDAGYATGHFGKWHMGGQRDVGEAPLITEYGFDESLTNFEGLGPRILPLKYSPGEKAPKRHGLGSGQLGRGPITWKDRSVITQEFTDAAIDFVKKTQTEEKPFYINVWPDDVHSPFHPPLDQFTVGGARRKNYLAVLETMDRQLGKLFDLVRNDRQLRDNTLILVCSDNGHEPECGSAGILRGAKVTLYEGGIRSPLVVWGPGLIEKENSGMRNKKSIFSAIDLVPSLLDLAKVNVPSDVKFDGERLLPTLLGNSDTSRERPLYFRRPPDRKRWKKMTNLPDLAIRDGRWKLLCDYDGSKPQLYDIFADHGEKRNLANDAVNEEIIKRMTKQVLAWHESMPADKGADFK